MASAISICDYALMEGYKEGCNNTDDYVMWVNLCGPCEDAKEAEEKALEEKELEEEEKRKREKKKTRRVSWVQGC